jgi:hypothetical protein
LKGFKFESPEKAQAAKKTQAVKKAQAAILFHNLTPLSLLMGARVNAIGSEEPSQVGHESKRRYNHL